MSLRGETIGRAYVKILADGSGLPDSIKDEIRDSEPIMEAEGQRSSAAYREGFNKDFEKEFSKDLEGALDRGIGRINAIEKYLNGPEWNRQLDVLHKKFHDVGVLAGADLEKGVRESGVVHLADDMENIAVHLSRAQQKINTALHTEALRMNADFDRVSDNLHANALRMNADWEKQTQEFRRSFAETDKLLAKGFQVSNDAARNLTNTVHDLVSLKGEVQKFDDAWDQYGASIERAARKTRILNIETGHTNDTLGRTFGRGARNNFVNFVGIVVGGIGSLIQKLPFFNRSVGSIGDKLSEVFSGDGSILAKMGGTFAAVGPEVAAFAAVFAAVALVLGPVAALISGIAAAVVALAASLTFALVGALTVGAGALLAFGAAAVIATTSLIHLYNQAPKKFIAAFKPLRETFGRLSDIAAKPIWAAISDALPQINSALSKMGPLWNGVGLAVGTVVQRIGDFATSTAFRKFRDAMEVFLPGAIEDLGRIMENTFKIITGILRAAFPSIKRLLDNIDAAFQRWSDWVNSGKGQNTLKDFFDHAADSAETVFDLIGDIGVAIGLLIGAGRKPGDSLFGSLDQKVEDFITFLRENPDAVKDFFANGKDVAEAIGRVAEELIVFFDALDSPAARENLQRIFTLVGWIFDGLNLIAGAIEWINGLALDAYNLGGDIYDVYFRVKELFREITDNLSNLPGNIAAAFLGVGALIIAAFTSLGPDILAAIGTIALDTILDAGGIPLAILNAFVGVGAMALSAIGSIDLASIIDPSHIAETIRNAFPGMAAIALSAAGTFAAKEMIDAKEVDTTVKHSFLGMATLALAAMGTFAISKIIDAGTVVSTVKNAFSGLASTALIAMGHFVLARIIDASTVVSAVRGFFSGGAQWALTAMGKFLLAKIIDAAGIFEAVVGPFRGLADDIVRAIGSIDIFPNIHWPSPPSWLGNLHIPIATGGIFTGPTKALIAEAGPEAVVPLNRPLAQVDPAVRWLSAIAQGLAPPAMAAGGIAGQRSIDVGGITIITPTEDPRAVAQETIDRLAVASYF